MVRRIVAVLAAVLLLAGCQDDPEPKVADPAPSPTAASSAVVSESPEPETAEAFIRRWAETSTAMQNSGDSAAYRSITDGCGPCEQLATSIDTYYAAGGSVTFDGLTVKSVKPVESSPGTKVVDVDVVVGPTTYTTSSEAAPESLAGGQSTYRMTLSRSDRAWNLDNYTELDS